MKAWALGLRPWLHGWSGIMNKLLLKPPVSFDSIAVLQKVQIRYV